MNLTSTESVTIDIDGERRVSGLWQVPDPSGRCCVLAHGAGAGMQHPFMSAFAAGLAERKAAVLRYQFLYMERQVRRPDRPEVAHATVRAAIRQARERFPKMPLFAAGKSFGGRMTSQAQALEPLPSVRGLIFLGFPLHPPGNPSTERAKHLFEVSVPMLFLQGTRDELAKPELIQGVVADLGRHATLLTFPDADHSFRVPARSGRPDAEIQAAMLDGILAWMRTVE
jgi:predicted alpha/beta-hydrolase family hydrolase